jgi:hypothetical protein
MDRDELARAIVRVAHIAGNFRLRSGATSAEYFDKYRFESDPRLLRAIARQLAPLVPTETEVLAGLELGGIPIAAAPRPVFPVRLPLAHDCSLWGGPEERFAFAKITDFEMRSRDKI